MIQKLLILVGLVCLGLWGFFTVQARWEQEALQEELYRSKPASTPSVTKRVLKEGDLFGRLEVPRLNMSVMVMEGIASKTLRLGAGHIPGTAMGIAAHRDSFFRPLSKIQKDDVIRFTSLDGSKEYRVISTKIVGPKETDVLESEPKDSITLVTCYPFYYIGPAPKRFIVQAKTN
ncbi:MAG TPA: class D sortase [Terriglobia bacterium]|nr:class D sortase [Terriglobia bacterium]